MKILLAFIMTVTSVSTFALTNERAIALVKASRPEKIKNIQVESKAKNTKLIHYYIDEGVVCSTTVKETKDSDNLKTYAVSEGFCFM